MLENVPQRRETIRRLIRTRVVGTQDELCSLLKKEGFKVTQATLSRDLGALEARRVQRSDGGTVYELPDAPSAGGPERLRDAHTLVTQIDEADAMVVVRTSPGAASVVAAAIDAGKAEGVLGTIAGDDTIFIVPMRGTKPNKVANTLRTLWRRT